MSNLEPPLATAGSVNVLKSFVGRLTKVTVKHDYHNYKLDHQNSDTIQRVAKLKKWLALSPVTSVQLLDSDLVLVLFSLFLSKDVNKAFHLILLLCLSSDSHMITTSPTYKHNYTNSNRNSEIKLSGMDNWNSVLCYFDSLLFAMFARIDDYDDSLLLEYDSDSDTTKEFKLGLRLLVNIMRSGEATITTDLVQVVCTIFAELGFSELISKKQQDVVTCFEQLSNLLVVPMLTLKIDIIHSGKVDLNDDLKYMSERVLFLSVPEDMISDFKNETIQEEEESSTKKTFSKMIRSKRSKKEKDGSISLEECLSNYFNNSIKVKRVLQRRRTLTMEKNNLSFIASEPVTSSDVTPESTNSAALEDAPTSLEYDNSDSDRDLLSESDLKERNDFLGVVSYSNDIVEPTPLDGTRSLLLFASNSRSSYHSMASSMNRSSEDASPTHVDDESPESVHPQHSNREFLHRSISSPLTTQLSYKPSPLRHSRRDSMSKINEIITLTRSRSSTDASSITRPLIKRVNSTTLSQSANSGLEVTLPAWMFLQLLPYYSDFGNEDTDDLKKSVRKRQMSDSKPTEELIEFGSKSDIRSVTPVNNNVVKENPIRKSFSKKRPIVPICLKRYVFDEKGRTKKINKKFNIPTIIDLPYFVADDKPTEQNNEDTNRSFDRFRLVLQSAVCHRGNSVDSGHYVAATRKHPYKYSKDKKEKEEELVWLLFNDLSSPESKITETNFKNILDTEAPYLLFYRIEDHEFEPQFQNNSVSLRKVETADNILNPSVNLSKERHLLDRLSASSTIDPRDLRKNSIVSSLSLSSASMKKGEELHLINSESSTATSYSSSQTMVPPASNKPPLDQTQEEGRTNRHAHHTHTFSFTRSLSRTSSKPPPVSQKDAILADSPEYIQLTDRFYWYYQNSEGTFNKQSKSDPTKLSVPVLKEPTYQIEVSDNSTASQSKRSIHSSSSSTTKEVSTESVKSHQDAKILPTVNVTDTEETSPQKVLSPVLSSRTIVDGKTKVAGKPASLEKKPVPVAKPLTPIKKTKKAERKTHKKGGKHNEKCIIT